jgi:tetratricopeptide (TPR) repeat protein
MLDQDRDEEAEELFMRSVRLAPDDYEARYNLGVCLARRDRLQEALAHFDQAIALKPDFAEAYSSRGLALGKLNNTGTPWRAMPGASTSCQAPRRIKRISLDAQRRAHSRKSGRGKRWKAPFSFAYPVEASTISPDFSKGGTEHRGVSLKSVFRRDA